MTEEEVKEIYNRLLELTKAGTLQWKQTGESEFTTNFARASVTVRIGPDVFGDSPIVLRIVNDSGVMVALASSNLDIAEIIGGAFEKRFNLDVTELFNLVLERVYKYSETSEDILKELRKLKAS